MELTDWLLALHLIAAALLVAALVLFSSLIISGWKTADVPSSAARMMSISRIGSIVIGIGSLGALIFGIWLAVDIDAYSVWDGWVIGAIVLWAIAMAAGGRSGKAYAAAGERAQELIATGNDAPDAELGALMRGSSGLWLHLVTCTLVLLILIDMIWKPGA
jgi:uncharacterized membrane protein